MAEDIPLHSWMASLPEAYLNRSLSEVALPCCHNAGAREVKCIPPNTLRTFVGEALAGFSLISTLAIPFARRAAVCQELKVSELLQNGARVLDFRIGIHCDEIYICHGVVCKLTLQQALLEVSAFLAAHELEIVLVLIKPDWEHRFDFRGDLDAAGKLWQRLEVQVTEVLSNYLRKSNQLTLAQPIRQLLADGHRAIVLAQVPDGLPVNEYFVPMTSQTLHTSWRDETKTVEDLLRTLTEWKACGLFTPSPGTLKLLEVALPGSPSTVASEAMRAFRNFIGDSELAVGVNLDFPDITTLRFIVSKNWPALQS